MANHVKARRSSKRLLQLSAAALLIGLPIAACSAPEKNELYSNGSENAQELGTNVQSFNYFYNLPLCWPATRGRVYFVKLPTPKLVYCGYAGYVDLPVDIDADPMLSKVGPAASCDAENQTDVEGENCCASGGKFVTLGTDSDDDGVIDHVTSEFVICNGEDGTNGTNGTDGTDGTDGTNGTNGTNGASCSVEDTDEGAKITCGDGDPIIIHDGEDGELCTAAEVAGGVTITCGASTATLLNGVGCTVEDTAEGAEVTCGGGDPVVIHDGSGCSFELTGTGIEISCEGDVEEGAGGSGGGAADAGAD
jgi:hypothetical protein